MYLLLGICLIFAFLLTLNLFVSVSASVVWRFVSGRAKDLSSRKQEQIIFGLRVFPVGAAVVFVLAFLLPAYLLYEPKASGEGISFKLALIALASLLGIGIALFRVFRTWLATRRLTANWLMHSEPVIVDEVDVPVYRIQHPFPVIAVVGMLRPRLFVASQIFDSLSPDEFRAAIAHEYGHLAAHDNFKRAFLRVCRDVLVFPLGRGLDKAWADNTEAAADEYAAMIGGKSMALDLAEALIKIARIVPANVRPAMPAGSFMFDAHDGELNGRVRRLLNLSEGNIGEKKSAASESKRSFWLYSGLLLSAIVLLASNKSFLLAIHNVSESVVAFLH
jgi:Zn-dependent protease with chaperone function